MLIELVGIIIMIGGWENGCFCQQEGNSHLFTDSADSSATWAILQQQTFKLKTHYIWR